MKNFAKNMGGNESPIIFLSRKEGIGNLYNPIFQGIKGWREDGKNRQKGNAARRNREKNDRHSSNFRTLREVSGQKGNMNQYKK